MEKNNFTTKIYEACGNDTLRPMMNCVHCVNGFLLATDGSIAIMQSLEHHSILTPEMLEGKSIHRDSFKKIMQYPLATATEEGIKCVGDEGQQAFFAYFDTKGQQPPDVEKLIQDFKPKGVDWIGFNARLMEKVISAMYTTDGGVRVRFGGVDRCMYIDALGIENQKAVIMPVILQDVLF